MNSGNNGISCSSVSSLLLELSIFGMDMTTWTSLYLCGFLGWDILKCSGTWKSLPCLSWIFSDMICVITWLVPRVVHVSLSIVLWPCFTMQYELVTMHAPWLSHCKSSWSCMNWKLGSKHLDVMHDIIPHATTKCLTTKWSGGPSLRNERYVNKLSNLLSLTECGFHDLLEEDGLFYLNMDV